MRVYDFIACDSLACETLQFVETIADALMTPVLPGTLLNGVNIIRHQKFKKLQSRRRGATDYVSVQRMNIIGDILSTYNAFLHTRG